ncbi:MAG: Hint domain-containing protein, partial [Rhodobacteraceae bacterium]|nr:Hint domain-containing protein [Paracoccaceae bacterium]
DAGDAADGSNDDLIEAGAGNDTVTAGDGNDVIYGGTGDDDISGGAGDDTFVVEDSFGNDTITGGETGEGNGDTLDLSATTTGVTLDLTDANAETGSISDGTDTANFTEIENITLGGGADTIILADGSGADTVSGFAIPTDLGGGNWAGIDQLDVSGLTDAGGDPVNTGDVVISEDIGGNAVLTFPNGESITLIGVDSDVINNSSILEAMGIPTARDNTVEGTSGDDEINVFYNLDPEGDMVDAGDGPGGTNDDLIEAYGGNDTAFGGVGDDTVYGGAGHDTLHGEAGNDTLFGEADNDDLIGGDGDDTIYGGTGDDTVNGQAGNDILYGGDGVDLMESGSGNDVAYGGGGEDSINGDLGNDTVYGGAGNDYVRGSYGNDTVYGGEGDDFVWGGYGDDVLVAENDFGNDTFVGEEEEEVYGDTLDLSAITDDLTIDLSGGNAEVGTFTDGTFTATFEDIEHIQLSSGTDTLILADGSGADRVLGFAAPVDAGGGAYTGQDQLDVTGLTDAGGAPVNTGDVTVTDDGSGNAVLTFPNGESITLVGVAPADVTSPAQLAALGIPSPDYTVSGTAGDDTIDAAYTGDPDGDMVDAEDAADSSNDDIIEAGAGSDTVNAGDGNDLILGEAGNDQIYGGTGDDSAYGGTGDDALFGLDGDDTLFGGAGSDALTGGAGNDDLYGGDDFDRFDLANGFGTDTITGGEGGSDADFINAAALTADTTVTYSGDEAGTLTDGTSTATFSEIEAMSLGGGDDTVDASAATNGIVMASGDGNDSIIGSDGADLVMAGAGNDTVTGGDGADTVVGGAGDDTVTVAQGDSVSGDDGDDLFILEDRGESGTGTITVDGGTGNETGGDTLQLGTAADLSTLVAVDDGSGSFSGSVTLDDGSTLNFTDIENIICFTPGTQIATPQGARAIEGLAIGDLVVTRDHGLKPIRWIGKRKVPARGRFAPVKLRAGTCAGLERDLLVSPQHRMLFQGYKAELLFGTSEVLVPAKHLIDGLAVTQEQGGEVTYIHILFDQHEVIYAEGAATESFHPGEIGLDAVTAEAREELFALFPELRALPMSYGKSARRSLRVNEARLIRALDK